MSEKTDPNYSEVPTESKRVSPTPKSELDLSMMTTDPTWGQRQIPAKLYERLSRSIDTYDVKEEVQMVILDNVDKVIEEMITERGYKKHPIINNIYEFSNKYHDIIITVNRETGQFHIKTITKKISKQGYWDLLALYHRDLRLGNLDDGSNPFKQDEVRYCEYNLNLAGDLLRYEDEDLPEGFVEVVIVHLIRVATKIEISHSKRGWFRKQSATLSNELKYEGIPPDPGATKMFGHMKPGIK